MSKKDIQKAIRQPLRKKTVQTEDGDIEYPVVTCANCRQEYMPKNIVTLGVDAYDKNGSVGYSEARTVCLDCADLNLDYERTKSVFPRVAPNGEVWNEDLQPDRGFQSSVLKLDFSDREFRKWAISTWVSVTIAMVFFVVGWRLVDSANVQPETWRLLMAMNAGPVMSTLLSLTITLVIPLMFAAIAYYTMRLSIRLVTSPPR